MGSDCANVLGLWPLLALGSVVLYCLTVLQIAETLTDDVGVMDEKVLASIFGCDESVSLLFTEPLHCTVGQTSVLPGNF
jgi:hypothetical protein